MYNLTQTTSTRYPPPSKYEAARPQTHIRAVAMWVWNLKLWVFTAENVGLWVLLKDVGLFISLIWNSHWNPHTNPLNPRNPRDLAKPSKNNALFAQDFFST